MNVMFGAKVMATTCVCRYSYTSHKHRFFSSRLAYLHCIYVYFMYYQCMHAYTYPSVCSRERERIGYERL